MWRPLLEADLLLKLSGAELAGFRAAALGSGQGDPVDAVIEQNTAVARGFIGRNLNNLPLGNGSTTLPDELIGTTVDLIVLDVMSRAAGIVLDPDGVRKENGRRAMNTLREVARGMFIIGVATDPSTEQLSYARPSFNPRGVHHGYGRHAEREF